MHTFQPYPIDMLNMNPFTKIGKEWALISAGDKNKCNTMTVSWGGVGVLWGKNVVYIFIRDSRYTKEFIDNGEFFSMSFFNEKYRDALSYCGKESGRNVDDKFKGAGLTPAFRHNIPYPDEEYCGGMPKDGCRSDYGRHLRRSTDHAKMVQRQ